MAGEKKVKAREEVRKSPYHRPVSRNRTSAERGTAIASDHDTASSNRNHARLSRESIKPNPDNPLYAYLKGDTETRKETSRKGQRPGPSTPSQRPAAPPGESVESHTTPGYVSMHSAGISIVGSGAAHNSFSIRGASSTSVSIKNLAPGTTQADIVTILSQQVGEVERVTTFPVRGGLSTTAEVKFGSRIAADLAIRLLNGALADNKRLEVSILLLPDDTTPDHRIHERSPAPTVERSKLNLSREDGSQVIKNPKFDRDSDRLKSEPRSHSSRDLFEHRAVNKTSRNTASEKMRLDQPRDATRLRSRLQ